MFRRKTELERATAKVVLDPETNMPVLPERYVWTVDHAYPDARALMVSIALERMRPASKTVLKEEPRFLGLGKRKVEETVLEGEEPIYTNVASEVLQTIKIFYWNGVDNSDARPRLDADVQKRINKLLDKGWTKVQRFPSGLKATRHWEPTLENIQKAAKICYVRWMYEQEAAQTEAKNFLDGKSFVGIYPPRKLSS